MTDFNLEERYIVVKLKDLTEDQRSRLESRMDNNDIIPVQQALVLESDWPEFGPALKMLEYRINGKMLEDPDVTEDFAVALAVANGDNSDMAEALTYKSRELAKALEDVKAANLTAETMRVQKEDFMKLADERRAELEALKEDLANHDSATKLINAWVDANGKQIPWNKAIDIIAIVTKMPEVERRRLLDMDDNTVVAWANSKDLESDGHSHTLYVHSEQPGNGYVDGGIPVALYRRPPEEPVGQISWSNVEPWFLQNEQMLKDVGKFEGLKGVALEVWRAAKTT